MKRTVVTLGAVRATILTVLLLTPVIAQADMRWGDFQRDACVDIGKRQFSSRLWDIPWGQSWESACASMGATINGIPFNAPTRCKNQGALGMWGEFDVPDASCTPRWGSFKKDHCPRIGVRQYSSRLDVPGGLSWEAACPATPSTVDGRIPSRAPDRCKNQGAFGMWGEFDVPDPSCPHWGPFTNRCAHDKDGFRYFEAALLDIPPGMSWMQTCQNFPADVAGRHFDRPTMCLQELHVYGRFEVGDTACKRPTQPAPVTSRCPSKTYACYTWVDNPICDTRSHPDAYRACDQNGYFCCAYAKGARDPRCKRPDTFSFPAQCAPSTTTPVSDPNVEFKQYGCYKYVSGCVPPPSGIWQPPRPKGKQQ